MSIEDKHFTDGREPEEAVDSLRSGGDTRCPDSPRGRNTPSPGSPGRRSPTSRRGKKGGRGRRGGAGSSPASSPNRTPSRRKGKNPTSPPHDAPMGKKDIYFALDCEMVGVGNEGLESALARVTIVNYDEEIVLDKFVKVPVPVTDYRTFVSGVRKEDIESDHAITWEECRILVRSLLHGKILIGHGLQSDLKAIGISHPWCDVRDTANYAPYMRKVMVNKQNVLLPRKLRDLVWEEFGEQIQLIGKAHSPVEDAVAALSLYKAVRNEWETFMMNQVNKARRIEESSLQMQPRTCHVPEHHMYLQRSEVKNPYFSDRSLSPPQMDVRPRISHLPEQHMYLQQSEVKSPYFPDGRLSPPQMDARPVYGSLPRTVATFRPIPLQPQHQNTVRAPLPIANHPPLHILSVSNTPWARQNCSLSDVRPQPMCSTQI